MSQLYPKSQGSLQQIYSNCVLENNNRHIHYRPEITLFKAVYKRHTLFTIESIDHELSSNVSFDSCQRFVIKRHGDLINKIYLQVTLPHIDYPIDTTDEEKSYWTNRVGFNLINNVELTVGGQLIDKLYGLYMHIWSELTHSKDKKLLLDKMVGSKGDDGISKGLCCDRPHTLTIPIFLPCHEYIQNSIPLIALQYHDVSINFTFNSLENCIQKGLLPPNRLSNVKLWIDYIFLDTEERRLFAQSGHEYLNNYTGNMMEQFILNKSLFNLNFYHCVKELFWVVRNKNPLGDKFTDFTIDNKKSNIKEIQMYKNGKEIFSSGAKKNKYFNYYLPYRRHTGKPDLGINCYPFAIFPEKFEPFGHLNFAEIDNFKLEVTKETEDNCEIFIYARFIDHLRVMSGMGGRRFVN